MTRITMRGVCWLLGSVLAATGCSSPIAPDGTPPGTFARFTGRSGDLTGEGGTNRYTPDSATFEVWKSDGTGAADAAPNSHIRMNITPVNGESWALEFAAPRGRQLTPGFYEGAAGPVSYGHSTAALAVTHGTRRCDTLSGRFAILDVAYASSGQLDRFHVTFEQTCEDGSDALTGEVRITTDGARIL